MYSRAFMSRLVRLLAPLALVTVLGCPLDIEFREPDTGTDAGPWACEGPGLSGRTALQ